MNKFLIVKMKKIKFFTNSLNKYRLSDFIDTVLREHLFFFIFNLLST